jgi:hypothetical protein
MGMTICSREIVKKFEIGRTLLEGEKYSNLEAYSWHVTGYGY